MLVGKGIKFAQIYFQELHHAIKGRNGKEKVIINYIILHIIAF